MQSSSESITPKRTNFKSNNYSPSIFTKFTKSSRNNKLNESSKNSKLNTKLNESSKNSKLNAKLNETVSQIELIHYSFGAPRSGNVKYADTFAQLVPTSIRVVNTEDSIPTLPPATINNNIYEQTLGLIPFTKSLGSFDANHITAYIDYMPDCSQTAKNQTFCYDD
jgi:hypothetical protein